MKYICECCGKAIPERLDDEFDDAMDIRTKLRKYHNITRVCYLTHATKYKFEVLATTTHFAICQRSSDD